MKSKNEEIIERHLYEAKRKGLELLAEEVGREVEAAIVAYLRERAQNYLDRAAQCRHATPVYVREYTSGELLNYAADAIERGEHREENEE